MKPNEILCKAGKHSFEPANIRFYCYTRKYVTIKGEQRTYNHEVQVCLRCLQDKREAKKGKMNGQS